MALQRSAFIALKSPELRLEFVQYNRTQRYLKDVAIPCLVLVRF